MHFNATEFTNQNTEQKKKKHQSSIFRKSHKHFYEYSSAAKLGRTRKSRAQLINNNCQQIFTEIREKKKDL
jgi:hypothetical protein